MKSSSSDAKPEGTAAFTVPCVPPTINKLSRKHWSYRVNQKGLWTGLLLLHLKRAWINKLRQWATEGVKIHVQIHVIHQRQFDPDNLYSAAKIPLDALKTMGCLADDSNAHIELTVTQEKGKPETRFTFTRAV